MSMSSESYNKRTIVMPSNTKVQYTAPETVIAFLFNVDKNTLRYKKSDEDMPPQQNHKARNINEVEIRNYDYNPIILLAILARKVRVISITPFPRFEVMRSVPNRLIPQSCATQATPLNHNTVYNVTLSCIFYGIEYIFHVKLQNQHNLWELQDAACTEVAGKLLILFSIDLFGDILREKNKTETPYQYELNIKKSKENLKLLGEVLLEKVPIALYTDHASDIIDLMHNPKICSPTIPGMDIAVGDTQTILKKCGHLNPWNIYVANNMDGSKVITITHDLLPTIPTNTYPPSRNYSTGDIHERVSSPVPLSAPSTPPPTERIPIDRFVRNTRGGYNKGYYRGGYKGYNNTNRSTKAN